jgi:flagellar basal-body rod protein FlgF
VQGLDGTEAYTRAGSLEVSPEGNLVTMHRAIWCCPTGARRSIPAGADITIGADGTVSAKAPGQAGTNVGRLKMVTPDANQPIQRGDDGLFRTARRRPIGLDPQARLQSGTLEGSNVNTDRNHGLA